jgi:hypothetical protein
MFLMVNKLRYPATHNNLMDLEDQNQNVIPGHGEMTKYFWMSTMRGQGTLEPRRGDKLEDKISTTNFITPYTFCFKLQCNMWKQFVHHHNVSVSVFILLSLLFLAHKFRVSLRTMNQRPVTCRKITTTCVILHNLIRRRYPATHKNLMNDQNQNVIPGAWRNEGILHYTPGSGESVVKYSLMVLHVSDGKRVHQPLVDPKSIVPYYVVWDS